VESLPELCAFTRHELPIVSYIVLNDEFDVNCSGQVFRRNFYVSVRPAFTMMFWCDGNGALMLLWSLVEYMDEEYMKM